ncbi:MAG: hypothetical protein IJL52_10415 [Clostridia bacterium]|nr:hypothetical protein [Clostridia bacterium]
MFCMMKTPFDKKTSLRKPQGRKNFRGTTLVAANAAALQSSTKLLAMITGRPESLTQHAALGNSARERDDHKLSHRLTPPAGSLTLKWARPNSVVAFENIKIKNILTRFQMKVNNKI